ncbi:MAG: GspH/FimT family pseudopilin [Gemmatimonadetes bacterium]|nr:GspH/FimT family pseudopilin [Gemmatimonadota bacterium]
MSGRRRGFTIIELITVLGIMSLAVFVAVPAFRTMFTEDDVTRATKRVEALFRLARDSAVRSGTPVTVVIDSVSGLVWLDVPTAVLDSDAAVETARIGAPTHRSVTAGSIESSAARMTADHVVPGESLDLPAAIHLELPRARARFEFVPTGATFADTLLLRWSMGERRITLNRWTGDVVVF